jgi:hypothetical protein
MPSTDYGKGSDWRKTDFRKFRDNYDQIKPSKKKKDKKAKVKSGKTDKPD